MDANEPKPCDSRSPRLELALFIVTLLLLEAAYFWDALRPGWVLSAADWLLVTESFAALGGPDYEPANRLLTDIACQMEPWQYLAGQEWRAGRVPLWNPYAGCGAPLLANAQSGVFNPINLVYFLTGSPYAWVAMAMMKQFIAGVGAFLFARALGLGQLGRWFAGLVFPLSGFVVVWLQYPMGGVAAWFPLILWLVERLVQRPVPARSGWLALALGAMLLGGHPETALHIIIVAGLYFVWRTCSAYRATGRNLQFTRATHEARHAALFRTVWFGAALIVGFFVAAVQLVPLAEYLRYSQAWSDRSAAVRGPRTTQMPDFLAMPALIAPYVYGSYLRGHPHVEKALGVGNFNEIAGGYTGLATLALLVPLALVTRRHSWIRFWFWADVVALAVAYHFPGVDYVVRWIPVLNITKNQRLLLVVALGHSLLGAAGVEAWRDWCTLSGRRLARVMSGLLAVIAVICASAAVLVLESGSKIQQRALSHFAHQADLRGLDADALRHRADTLAAQTQRFFPRYYGAVAAYAGCLSGLGWLVARVAVPARLLRYLLLVVAVDLFWFGRGYNPAIPMQYYFPASPHLDWAWAPRAGRAASPFRVLVLEEEFPPNTLGRYEIADIRNYDAIELASHLKFFGPLWASSGQRLTSNSWTSWESVRENIDRLRLANVRYLISTTRPLTAIEGATLAFQRGRVSIYEIDNAHLFALYSPEGEDMPQGLDVEMTGIEPGRISAKLRIEAAGARRLVLAECYMPGWKCWVDDRVVTVDTFRDIFMSVPVGPGEHHVHFEYQPASFVVGLALSGFGLLFCASLVWALRPLHRERLLSSISLDGYRNESRTNGSAGNAP